MARVTRTLYLMLDLGMTGVAVSYELSTSEPKLPVAYIQSWPQSSALNDEKKVPACVLRIRGSPDSNLFGFEAKKHMSQREDWKEGFNNAQLIDGFKVRFLSQPTEKNIEYACFLKYVFCHSLKTIKRELGVGLRSVATEINITVPASWPDPVRANLCAFIERVLRDCDLSNWSLRMERNEGICSAIALSSDGCIIPQTFNLVLDIGGATLDACIVKGAADTCFPEVISHSESENLGVAMIDIDLIKHLSLRRDFQSFEAGERMWRLLNLVQRPQWRIVKTLSSGSW